MTFEEFLKNSSDEITYEMRALCNNEGHRPYISDGQGNDEKIHGCYCGWIKLITPININKKNLKWEDFPEAKFDCRA